MDHSALLWSVKVSWSVKAAFIFLCALGSVCFIMWIIACLISATAFKPRRRANDHRVGGVINP